MKLTPKQALLLIKEDEEMRHDWLYANDVEEIVANSFEHAECKTGCGMCDICVGIDQDTQLFLEQFMQILMVLEYDESTFHAMQHNSADVKMMDEYTTVVTYDVRPRNFGL